MERAAGHEGSGISSDGSLYVVATPIGNLKDVTLRALEVLRTVETIAAEDTRVTARLLDHHGIRNGKLVAMHEHNENRATSRIISDLRAGRSVALVSDAGTPAFSDPGARLVASVRDAGFKVVPVPGPNAAAAALSVSGFAGPQFVFYGFLPAKAGERRKALEGLAASPHLLVLYEAPHRVRDTLADLVDIFGEDRRLVLARELTKMYETIHACTLGDARVWLDADINRVKGEFVLLIEGRRETGASVSDEARRTLELLLEELPLKQAAALAARITGARKNDLYALALSVRGGGDPPG